MTSRDLPPRERQAPVYQTRGELHHVAATPSPLAGTNLETGALMQWLGLLRIGGRALARNRLRSLLTMLGIVIGVSTFEAMVAVTQGVRAAVTANIESIGANLVLVQPNFNTRLGLRRAPPSMSDGDAEVIARLPSVVAAAPVIRTMTDVKLGDAGRQSHVYGTTPSFFAIRRWLVARGTLFTDDDVRAASRVCLVGRTVLGDAREDAVGLTLRVHDSSCRVIGVLAPKGSNMFGVDEDDSVIMPYTTMRRHLTGGDSHTVDLIVASAIESGSMARTKREIAAALRSRRHTRDGAGDDFFLADMSQVSDVAGQAFRLLGRLLWAIATMSLLVGGIGIMNIMLVSVTERTREIGIRVAMGAGPSDILGQFLVEALLLSAFGGLIGLGLGAYGADLLARTMGWPRLLTLAQLCVGFGFAAAVGVVFGLYPAIRASRLDPIDALRFE
jgi:putative ABC transport system permease protein